MHVCKNDAVKLMFKIWNSTEIRDDRNYKSSFLFFFFAEADNFLFDGKKVERYFELKHNLAEAET